MLRDSTVDSTVADSARRRPDAVAVICRDAKLTYGQLEAEADRFAAWMVDRGLKPGDRVSVWLPNGLAWVVVQVAVAKAGAVTVPINTKLQTEEAHYIVAHSDSRFLVAADDFLDRDYRNEAAEIAGDIGCETVYTGWNRPNLPAGPGVTLPGSNPDEPAVLQYTSGTTGRPKGCMLSHRTWTNNARISADLGGVTAETCVFTPSPFFHLFGSLTALMGAFSHAACLATVPIVEPGEVAAEIERTSTRHMIAVPTVWLDLMGHVAPGELPSLRSGFWGGASFPGNKLRLALTDYGWDLQAIYGMTEAPTLAQVRAGSSIDRQLNTVGEPTPGVELRVVDPETRQPVNDAPGEIIARGYNVMLGYYQDPGATEQRVDAHGWIRTGDIGRLDDGFLVVEGRLTDMIITGGANVYAREVEDILMRAPDVELAAVVSAPDERLGEVPVGFVQLADGSTIDETQLRGFCREHLASYKVPRAIHIVQTLPITGSGKIEKAALTEIAASKGG